MDYIVHPGENIKGTTTVPGDKSISHRSLILGALADGITTVEGILDGEDCLATARVLGQLGVDIEWDDVNRVRIQGRGLRGLRGPSDVLDFGNSGTGIRLFMGLLAGQPFASTLTGDISLLQRPMSRVSDPLSQMGARIQTTDGKPPVTIAAVDQLTGIDYLLPVASAQVKSALLLAGLFAAGPTCVTEPAPTRDHTERMLNGMGVEVVRQQNRVCVGPATLSPAKIQVPGDFSSAAFLLVAAAVDPRGDLTIKNVGVNPTRIGLLTALGQMGAEVTINQRRKSGGEDLADIQVRGSNLRGITVDPALVPLMIDEFPVLFAAAALGRGETVVTGAQELRAKESDRLESMAQGLSSLGIKAETTLDGIRIQGGRPSGGTVDSFDDHRIAMAFSVLAHRATGPVRIRGVDNVATSFPGYHTLMGDLGVAITISESL